MKILTGAVAGILFATQTLALEGVTITYVENPEIGQYLTDSGGRPVYVFSTDIRASDDQPAHITCTGADCLEAWPPLTTPNDPQAGDGVDAALLGTTEHNAQQVVTYQGRPLYHFADDEGAEVPQGNEVEAFGGTWALLDPSATTEAGDIAAGQSKYAGACAQCHGRTGRGMASFPSIAGQEHEYITIKLMQYRARERVGPNSALMFPVAARLSDEDIANLAAYISTEFE